MFSVSQSIKVWAIAQGDYRPFDFPQVTQVTQVIANFIINQWITYPNRTHSEGSLYVDTIIFHCLIMIGQSQLFSFLWQFDSPRYFNGSKSLLALISLPIICQKICTILFVVTSFFLFWVLANSVITASVRSTLWSGIVSKLLKLIPLQKRSKFNKVKASVALDFSPIIFYLPFFCNLHDFFSKRQKPNSEKIRSMKSVDLQAV